MDQVTHTPVSNLPSVSKVLEKLVLIWLLDLQQVDQSVWDIPVRQQHLLKVLMTFSDRRPVDWFPVLETGAAHWDQILVCLWGFIFIVGVPQGSGLGAVLFIWGTIHEQQVSVFSAMLMWGETAFIQVWGQQWPREIQLLLSSFSLFFLGLG